MVLNETIGDMSSCGMEVLQAYLHFEALRSQECPSLLMIDLYQKGIFNMAGVHCYINHFCLQHKYTHLKFVDIFHNLVVNLVLFFVGIEIQGMPEPLIGEVNAEEIWDSVCTEIIISGLNARKFDLVSHDQQSYTTLVIIFLFMFL